MSAVRNLHDPLRDCVRRLGEEEFPLFAHTARRIASISSDDKSSSNELAQVILVDSAMTARVLRMANSAYYNPSGGRINTVSRAIVVLGYDVVRTIALSVSLVDSMLSGSRHESARAELVRSFHAAVQAKEFASLRNAANVEEIFIAALLNRLGHVAFWCFPYGMDAKLSEAYESAEQEESAEKAVLGFTLRELTAELTKEWHLSTLLTGALSNASFKDKNVLDIEHGFRIANAVEKDWNNGRIKQVIAEISNDLDRSKEFVTKAMYLNARKAAKVLDDYGFKNPFTFIPEPPGQIDVAAAEPQPPVDEKAQLQISILRELTSMLSEGEDLNTLLSTVLEGVYRALDMDRVCLALLSADRQKLTAKYAIGDGADAFKKLFSFDVFCGRDNIFTHVLAANEPLWLDRKTRIQLGSLIVPEIYKVIGSVELFVMPIRIQGKPRGVIYADRGFEKTPFDDNTFLTFKHFCEHANIAFSVLTNH